MENRKMLERVKFTAELHEEALASMRAEYQAAERRARAKLLELAARGELASARDLKNVVDTNARDIRVAIGSLNREEALRRAREVVTAIEAWEPERPLVDDLDLDVATARELVEIAEKDRKNFIIELKKVLVGDAVRERIDEALECLRLLGVNPTLEDLAAQEDINQEYEMNEDLEGWLEWMEGRGTRPEMIHALRVAGKIVLQETPDIDLQKFLLDEEGRIRAGDHKRKVVLSTIQPRDRWH